MSENAKDDKARRNASRASVRGLRRCTNAACAAHLNRDYNAAVNIQRRCKAMLLDDASAPTLSAEERELDLLQQRVRAGG